jgi:tRNA(Ile)-lysidine synthase
MHGAIADDCMDAGGRAMHGAIAEALSNYRQKIYIAYSGGVDSHVLLHCCASMVQLKGKLTAVYVDHGLQAAAKSWAGHCEQTAKDLAVDFLMLRVNAEAARGESPEEAARNARYAALQSLVDVGDALLLAQHREDQLETVLLQLFRGSGLCGLSGMPEHKPFGLGVLLRPLLNTPKQAISDYAHTHQLRWVEDPSNQSSDYDRNFLRNEVVPLLKKRWPAIDKTVARSAKHCADAQDLLDTVADKLFAGVFNPEDNTLSISRLMQHRGDCHAVDIRSRQLIIRHWFRYMGLKMPALALVGRILSQVVAVDGHRDPVILAQGYRICRYRDKLYCLKQAIQEAPQDLVWPAGQSSIKINHSQTLCCMPASVGIPSEQWKLAKVEVKFRRGGEKISLPGRQGHHSLKNLFQEAAIPPWERNAIPLIYLNGTLAAVGDKWISGAFFCEKSPDCVSFLLQS